MRILAHFILKSQGTMQLTLTIDYNTQKPLEIVLCILYANFLYAWSIPFGQMCRIWPDYIVWDNDLTFNFDSDKLSGRNINRDF